MLNLAIDRIIVSIFRILTGLTHFKMKNPVRAGLSRLWATSEKS
jgi:hypothetical protein